MTKNRTRTPVYLDPGMQPGLEVKGLRCRCCLSVGRSVIRHYRDNASIHALTTGELVTQTEFL